MTQNRCFCFMEHPKKNSWMMTGGTPILRKLSHDSRQTSTGWWFGCQWLWHFPRNIGFLSSSQLTNSIIFQRGGPGPPTSSKCFSMFFFLFFAWRHQARSSHHEGRLAQSQLHAAPQEVTAKMRPLEDRNGPGGHGDLKKIPWLVGGNWLPWLWHFPRNVGNFIIPIDFHIFQRGGPTTNQMNILFFFNDMS